MISWFQAFAFSKCNLYRYSEEQLEKGEKKAKATLEAEVETQRNMIRARDKEETAICKTHNFHQLAKELPLDENKIFDSQQRFPPPGQSIRFLRVYSADTSKKTLPEVSRPLYTPNSRF